MHAFDMYSYRAAAAPVDHFYRTLFYRHTGNTMCQGISKNTDASADDTRFPSTTWTDQHEHDDDTTLANATASRLP